MAICRFYEQGTCRFGNNCKNEHISSNQSNSGRGRGGFGGGFNSFNSTRGGFNGGAGNSSRGPFSSNANRGSFNQRGNSRTNRPRERWTIDTRVIQADLTAERPVWPFSSYAPKSDAPRQLIEGKLEISAEEMRLEAYKLVAQGKTADILQIEAAAAAEMQKSIQRVLDDLNGAVKYIADGRDVHPNRYDIEDGVAADQAAQSSIAAQTPANPFGAPAASSSPFGSQISSSASNPFGQPKSSPFGQTVAASSPFASAINSQQSGLSKPNPFGQASQPASGFGQVSTLGQAKPNPFGQSGSAGFGAATASSPFASQSSSSPFGQNSTINSAGAQQQNPEDASMMSPGPKINPFSATSSPFGQQQQPSATPFGQPSQLGSAQPNPFGPSLQSQITAGASTGPKINPFGQNSQTTQSLFARNQPQSAPTTFGQTARASSGSSGAAASRVIFDKGVPAQPHVDDPPQDMYDGHEDLFNAAYNHAKQHGTFENNLMPMLPPKIAWISYDNL